MASQIPTLDIRRFTHPSSPEDRQAFIDELGAAYREWGFAGIRNHGIPQAQIDEAYETFRQFFALPEEAKKPDPLTGWAGSGDTKDRVRLTFPSLEAAKAYADQYGIPATVVTGHERSLKLQAYADNFSVGPITPAGE